MATSIQANLIDRSAERTALRIPVMDMAAGTIAIIEGFQTELIDAVAALSLLSLTGISVNEVTKETYSLPTDDNAVRELAVRFVMADASMNQVAFSMGGPDLSVFPFVVGEGGDIYEWGSGTPNAALADFVSAVETVARHPISGGALTMQRLELVGRNN